MKGELRRVVNEGWSGRGEWIEERVKGSRLWEAGENGKERIRGQRWGMQGR